MTMIKAVSNLLPKFEDADESKRNFLSWMLSGFSKNEALLYSGTDPKDFIDWIRDDSSFLDTLDNIKTYEVSISAQLLSEGHVKNAHIAQAVDKKVLAKTVVSGLDGLGKNEFEYLLKITGKFNIDASNILQATTKETPQTWDQAIVVLRKNNEEKRQDKGEEKKAIIEGEYTKSSDVESR